MDSSAEAFDIRPVRAAFHTVLPNSGQNRSGTDSRIRPSAESPNSSTAWAPSVSAGRNHFAATLVSRMYAFIACGRHAAFLRNWGRGRNAWAAAHEFAGRA